MKTKKLTELRETKILAAAAFVVLVMGLLLVVDGFLTKVDAFSNLLAGRAIYKGRLITLPIWANLINIYSIFLVSVVARANKQSLMSPATGNGRKLRILTLLDAFRPMSNLLWTATVSVVAIALLLLIFLP